MSKPNFIGFAEDVIGKWPLGISANDLHAMALANGLITTEYRDGEKFYSVQTKAPQKSQIDFAPRTPEENYTSD